MPSPAPVPETAYHVFFSYNHDDHGFVLTIASKLRERGIRVWLDEDELQPGLTFVDPITDAIDRSDAVAVFVGSGGLGDFQRKEIDYAHTLGGERPVIPVILPGSPPDPKLPKFLGIATWVRFPNGVDDAAALKRLIWGITGNPDAGAVAAVSPVDPPHAAEASARSAADGEPAVDHASRERNLNKMAQEMAQALLFRNATYFVGTRAAPPAADHPPRPVQVSETLARKLNWNFAGPFRPTLDTSAAYFAIKENADTLELEVVSFMSQRDIGTPPLHQELAALVEGLKRRGKPLLKPDPRVLIVTTCLDVALERALLRAGVSFSRVVQYRSGTALQINEYREVSLLANGDLQLGASLKIGPDEAAALDEAIRDFGRRDLKLDDTSANVEDGNPLRGLAFETLAQPVLYKYHGSKDVWESCTISADQYFDLAHAVNVPTQITALIGTTPLVFLGCGLLDSDFRHLQHTLLRRAFNRMGKAPLRIACQLPPQEEPDDPYRQLECDFWDKVKDCADSELHIKVLEVPGEVFLRRLRAAAATVLEFT